MDIRIYFNNGKVKDINNVCLMESLRGGRELLMLYKDSNNETNVFTVQRADFARLTIFGETITKEANK